MEMLIRDGQYYTIGDYGPEFVNLKPNDIVLNHVQTRNLFRSGHSNGRGKFISGANDFFKSKSQGQANAFGNAFVTGGYTGNLHFIKNPKFYGNGNSKANGNNSKSNGKNDSETKEKIDWIAILIDRIARHVDKLGKIASSAFTKLETRLNAGVDQFKEIQRQIEESRKGAQRYLQEANSVGLDESYASKVRDGRIDIEKVEDENLRKKIQEYQKWYEKYLDLYYKEVDLTEDLGKVLEQRFNTISTHYEKLIGQITHYTTMLDSNLQYIEALGHFSADTMYRAGMQKSKEEMDKLAEQWNVLKKERDDALQTGAIEKGSEADLTMLEEINSIAEAWGNARNRVEEYKNQMLEMQNQIHDFGQSRMAELKNESDFIQNLLSVNEDDLFVEETGRLSDAGKTVNAMRAMNYATLMNQADRYGKRIKEIDKQLATDPNNKHLIDAKQQYVDAQREAIEAANEEKTAIRDLVADSYERILKVTDKLIDKRKEFLKLQKDTYDYEKKVTDQVDEVNSLRKQYMSLQNDDSEEAKAKRQQIADKLKDAERDLEETEYDKWLNDQESLMDDMSEDFEEFFDEKLTHLEEFLQESIDYANKNASDIKDTINSAVKEVGVSLSDNMESVWSPTKQGGKLFTTYGDAFITKLTTLNQVVSGIWTQVNSMIDVDKTQKPPYEIYFGDDPTKPSGNKPNSGDIQFESAKRNALDAVNAANSKKAFNDMANSLLPSMRNLQTEVASYNTKPTMNGDMNVTFNLPDVKNVDEFMHELQNNKKFEDWMKSATVDLLMGSNSLRKYNKAR